MAQIPDHVIHVIADRVRLGRYRWELHDGLKLRDVSLHSFATKHEAQADGDLFFGKLLAAWRTPT
jgi:hypothetical protein